MSARKISIIPDAPTAPSGKWSAGCVAAVTIASLAVVAFIVILVLYLTSKKKQKCTAAVVVPGPQHALSHNLRKPQERKVHLANVTKPTNVLAETSGRNLPVYNPPLIPASVPVLPTTPLIPASVPVLPTTPPIPVAPAMNPNAPVVPVVPVRPPVVPVVPVLPPVIPVGSPAELSMAGYRRAMMASDASATYAAAKCADKPQTQAKEAVELAETEGVGSVVQHIEGAAMQHRVATAIKNTGNTLAGDFQESDIAQFDPEGAAKLEAALALTGTPQRFHATDEEESMTRRAAIINNLRLAGKVDATVDDVMSITAPVVATKSALQRALNASRALERGIVLQTPMRFLYDTQMAGSRQAVPMPTMTPILPEFNMSPGQDFYYSSLQCSEVGKPVNFEGY